MKDSRRCKAHLTDGSGRRCMKAAIQGGTVCGSHGGGAPQVKQSARARLLEAAAPAAARLVKALGSEDERAAIQAAKLILDRAGLHPAQTVELTGPDGKPIEYADSTPIAVDSLSPAARRQILEILERERIVSFGREEGR